MTKCARNIPINKLNRLKGPIMSPGNVFQNFKITLKCITDDQETIPTTS